jgi:dolichyl-phosphate beta-glucosyltransferase
MNLDLTVSVIIPAYNEERRLPTTLHAIVEFLHVQPYASEIIVVDDGSSDTTAAVVEACRDMASPNSGSSATTIAAKR